MRRLREVAVSWSQRCWHTVLKHSLKDHACILGRGGQDCEEGYQVAAEEVDLDDLFYQHVVCLCQFMVCARIESNYDTRLLL